MLINFKTKKYHKTATVKDADKVLGDVFEKIEPELVSINVNRIESIRIRTIRGWLDGDDIKEPMHFEYYYYELRLMSGDRFDLDSVPPFLSCK